MVCLKSILAVLIILSTIFCQDVVVQGQLQQQQQQEAQQQSSLRGLRPIEQPPKPKQASPAKGIVHTKGKNGKPKVITGNLGNLGITDLSEGNVENVKKAAVNAMTNLGQNQFQSKSTQFKVKGKPTFLKGPKKQSTHIRLVNIINGVEVEGASIMMHIDSNGDVIAVNGEVISDDVDSIGDLSAGGKIPPKQAIDIALQELNLQDIDGTCEGNIELTVVATRDLQPW
jgi:hypothetical protein